MEEIYFDSGKAGTVKQNGLASPWIRLMAKLIDYALVLIPFVFSSIAGAGEIKGPYIVMLLLWYTVVCLVQCVMLTKNGQSIGKKLFKIKIIKNFTGETGGFVSNVILRSFMNFILSLLVIYAIIDALLIFRQDRRCAHDMLAGTSVIDLKTSVSVPDGVVVGENGYISGEVYNMNNGNNSSGRIIMIVISIVVGVFILLAIAAAVSISIYGNVVNKANKRVEHETQQITKLPAQTKPPELQVFTSNKGDFNLLAPKDWKRSDPSFNTNAKLILESGNKQAMLMVIGEGFADFKKGMKLEEYLELGYNVFKSKGINIDRKKTQSVRIGDFPGYRFEFEEVTKEGLRFRYMSNVVKTNKCFYQIISWSRFSEYEDFKEIFSDIPKTFMEVHTQVPIPKK